MKTQLLFLSMVTLLLTGERVFADATSVTNDTVIVTAAPLPKYRVETTTSGTLVDLPPEKAPFVVDSLTEDFIRERNPTDLDQLLALQPGIYQGGKTVMSRHAGTYTIRGFSGSEVLLGGVPLTGGIGTFLDPTLLAGVDIVKGPVGGAYGGQSNSMDSLGSGGSIILRAKQAQLDESFHDVTAKGSYSKGSGTRMKVFGDSNQVFIDDVFAVRVPYAYEWRDPGYAPSGAGYGHTYSIAPSFTWRIEDRLTIGADLLYQNSNEPAYQGIRTSYGKPVNGGGWDDTYTRAEDRMRFMTAGGTFRIDGDVTDWFSIRTRVSMYQTENRYSYRGPSSSATFSPTNLYEYAAGDTQMRSYYLSQEGIFKFDTGPVEHQFLVGVNFTAKHKQGWSWFGSTPLSSAESETTWQRKLGVVFQETASYAGLTAIMGVRADWHDSVTGTHVWTVSPRVGLSYDVLEAGWVIAFANASMTDTPNFNYKRFPSDKSSTEYLTGTWRAVQKEIGVRVNPVGSLWVTGTAFRIDQNDTPIGIGSGRDVDYYIEDGKNYSQGFEFSASGNLTDNWSMYVAYTYIDYYDKTNGLRFDRFPPNAVSFWTSYKAEWLMDTVFGLGARWRDDWEMTFRGQRAGSEYCAKSLLTVDASAELPIGEHWSLSLALRNIFDARGIESARNLQAFANDGRTIELSLHFHW